jgi:hypothetical protein
LKDPEPSRKAPNLSPEPSPKESPYLLSDAATKATVAPGNPSQSTLW